MVERPLTSRRRASAYSASFDGLRWPDRSALVSVRGLSEDFMVAVGLPRSCQRSAVMSTPNLAAARWMRRNASPRSSSVTPRTWSNRAIALRTWLASFSGTLRTLGNAKALTGIASRSASSRG
jgi:hypothetical protein